MIKEGKERSKTPSIGPCQRSLPRGGGRPAKSLFVRSFWNLPTQRRLFRLYLFVSCALASLSMRYILVPASPGWLTGICTCTYVYMHIHHIEQWIMSLFRPTTTQNGTSCIVDHLSSLACDLISASAITRINMETKRTFLFLFLRFVFLVVALMKVLGCLLSWVL